MSPTGSFEQQLKVGRRLLNDFRPERRIHLAVSMSSLIVQIVFFAVFWSNDQIEWTHFLALAGPGGMIIVTGNRILRMWSDTLRYLYPSLPGQGTN